jgi:hypothetical protein
MNKEGPTVADTHGRKLEDEYFRKASGGILGLAKISAEEQRALKRITEELTHRRGDAGPAAKGS